DGERVVQRDAGGDGDDREGHRVEREELQRSAQLLLVAERGEDLFVGGQTGSWSGVGHVPPSRCPGAPADHGTAQTCSRYRLTSQSVTARSNRSTSRSRVIA